MTSLTEGVMVSDTWPEERSMTPPLPRIAIPEPTSTDMAYNQRSLPQYVRAIEAAGGTAVPIRLNDAKAVQAQIFASCSGVLLPGSPADIDPERYGQRAIEECAEKDVAREAADDLLLRDAFEQGKPILGVCYGLQSLNVWRQGTLIQDLPHALMEAPGGGSPAAAPVNHQPGREVQDAHPVSVTPGSRLAAVLSGVSNHEPSAQEVLVNSSHHQAIDQPGQMLRVAAISPVDGVIEALEGATSEQFLLAVQWHPERSYENSAASREIFSAFVEAARAWLPAPHTGKA
jgi:putative glutamine amidotransferase